MIYVLIPLAIALIIVLVILGMGFYEYYLEDKQDRKAFDRMGDSLHLKHLDQINGNK